ncbi:Scramblase-domain-containing protein [Aulographum hederae CBS 113979]|uniref:Scramblase-domain-containing protein n=1 Tax=Aulographum hederae CBS 113979 TaxID=1176131 RepID=A0A6G1HDF7_9PEZI|nr:Scramblase-domain-containing protein [Aulographum hederae CBS 113979]
MSPSDSSGSSPPPSEPPTDQPTQDGASKNAAVSSALAQSSHSSHNTLLSPVHIPEDPHAVLKMKHPAVSLLANSSIIIQRQLEMMNVLIGFEQANRYIIMDPSGNHIGFLAEQEHGIGSTMMRQMAKTHRSFTTHVFDKEEREVLRFHRPFSYINSRINVYDALDMNSSVQYSSSTALQGVSAGSIASQSSAQISNLSLSEMRIIGEAQQQWAPLRRKYNLFLARDSPEAVSAAQAHPSTGSTELSKTDSGPTFVQFAHVNEPFLSWDFSLQSEDNQLLGSVNRNFAGWGRELFTDTGVYALRMDAAGLATDPNEPQKLEQSQDGSQTLMRKESPPMTLDQRAVMLATAVSIDFDYFSRHSHAGVGGGFMPLWFPGMGGTAGEAGAAGAGGAAAGEAGAVGGAAGAAGEAGALGEAGAAGAGALGRAGGAVGAGEGAIAGAGSMAGYEAMQRGMGRRGDGDDASPTANDPYQGDDGGTPGGTAGGSGQGEEVWGEDYGDWGNKSGGDGPPGAEGGGGGDGEGGGWGDVISSFFD